PLKASFMPTTKGSHVVQAVSVDSLACRRGSAESTIKTSLEQSPSLSESVTLSCEESEAKDAEGFFIPNPGSASLLNYSGILNLRDRVFASSESIQAQQKYLKELQEQIDAQREALLARQKIQEQLLLQKQDKLKEQQEALKEFLNRQVKHICTNKEETDAQKPDWINRTDFFQASENYKQENFGRSNFDRSEIISQYISSAEQSEQSEKVPCREQKWRSSKPPVTKVKLGLDLEQHELSVIPEADTPRSSSISLAGKKRDSVGGESSPAMTALQLGHEECYSHAVLREEDWLPLSMTNYEEEISNRSAKRSKQSSGLLQEVLMMAESSYDSGE
ncbi:CE295 protein, partial [Centropus bengalensis]|nr:CE295 protein [Centropus bengalensis]